MMAGPFTNIDMVGRQQPRRFGIETYLLSIAQGSPDRIRAIPSSAQVESGEDDEGSFTCIECPCGARPIARELIAKCPGCERWYVTIWPEVFVAYGNMSVPARRA